MAEGYEYVIQNKNRYYFKTAFDLEYVVEIINYPIYKNGFEHIEPYIYTLNVVLLTEINNKTPLDPRIGITVAYILGDFFQNEENAIIYVCESLDNRQKARKRKFDEWFNKYKGKKILQINMTAYIEGLEILNSLILHVNNPNFKEIVVAFAELNNNAEEK